ncbi:MAG: hypothetical protein DWI05_02975 [Planctomycetota bacterium]|nr:MAG: hypothetical protein DWI05_02975 [Planctomycetota bacterium]
MEHRLGRTLRVFLLVLATAGLYRLAVVPLVEPRVKGASLGQELSPAAVAAAKARADGRLAQVSQLFAPGSWELDGPNMLESRQMRLLFKDYRRMSQDPDDTRVQLIPCTLILLPDTSGAAGATPGRTVVLRAPQGAVLEFDEPFDLSKQERPSRLVGGSLRGQVTIRGTPTAPAADDEVEIVTRDVELKEMEITTAEAVQFRYGRSSGSGRAMEIRLLPGAKGSEQGPNIGGIDTIRLDRDVKLKLEGLAGGLIPGPPVPGAAGPDGSAPGGAAGSSLPPDETEEPVPVLVSCRGSLCMNVSANVISLEDHVDVVRTLPGGAHDQLACELLAVVLGRDEKQGTMTAGLKPVEIQAKGTPVVARSTGAGLEARAMRLGYEIATRRIVLDGEEPVSLVLQETEMEARSIDYTPGPPGDPGTLMAVGPGWLRARTADMPPLSARWQKWLRLRPDGAEHVASLAGEADVQVETQGRLKAGEIHLWLALTPGAPPTAAPARLPAGMAGVKPSRMLARSMVEIDVQQLTARTDKLEMWFKHEAVPPVAAPPPVPVAQAVAPQPAVAAAQSPAVAPAQPPTAQPPTAQPPASEAPTGRLIATGGLVRGLVTFAPQGPQLDELSLEGQVHLIEEPEAAARVAGQPAPEVIELRGDQLQISRANRFDARAVVSGRPAQVAGRGINLQGPLVEFDRGRNRLSVDGAGKLGLPIAGGLPGLESLAVASPVAQPAAQRVPAVVAGRLDIGWQGRMDFDGLTARFVDRVVTTSGDTALRAGSLDVVFTKQIDFSATTSDRTAHNTDVARIACGNGVRIESESVAVDGAKSVEKLFLRDLLVDRATGEVTGSGPGRLASTRFGASPGIALPGAGGLPGAAGAAQPTPAARPDELSYLGVDFQRGIRGNINRRQMEFHQRVEAIWGPVGGWNDTLDAHAAGGLPPRAVAITSDVLSVGQAAPLPGLRRGTLELGAAGNVMVEGEAFTARSSRLSYSEAKDLLVFEGDGRSDAQLFRQERIGAPTSSASAGKILYWRGLNQVEVNDARFIDLDQLGGTGGAARLPGFGGAKP